MGYKTKNSATLVTNFGKMEKEIIVSKRKVKKKFKISRLDEPEPSVQSMHAEPGQCKYNMYLSELVGNKAKGRISEWVFQEKEARQIFGKTNISYTLIRIRTFSGGREKMHWEQMG